MCHGEKQQYKTRERRIPSLKPLGLIQSQTDQERGDENRHSPPAYGQARSSPSFKKALSPRNPALEGLWPSFF